MTRQWRYAALAALAVCLVAAPGWAKPDGVPCVVVVVRPEGGSDPVPGEAEVRVVTARFYREFTADAATRRLSWSYRKVAEIELNPEDARLLGTYR